MTLRRLFATPPHHTPADVALLLTRIIFGAAMMNHGYVKILNPFGWLGADAFAPPPFQALAALSEFGGGLAVILGLLVPLAALGIASTMVVAFGFHMASGDPLAAAEQPAVYFCVAVLLIAIGPGRFSLDRLIFGRR